MNGLRQQKERNEKMGRKIRKKMKERRERGKAGTGYRVRGRMVKMNMGNLSNLFTKMQSLNWRKNNAH